MVAEAAHLSRPLTEESGVSKSTSAVQPLRLRRVSRRRETQRDVVLTAVPSGSVRAAHGRQAIAALRSRPEWTQCTAGRRKRLLACLCAVIERADYETMTSRPTWARLAERVGVSRASVARYLRTLREWGLLGVVASGRTAPYASLPEDGSERTNEAAVYVVCMPSPLAAVDATAAAVDKNETPPAQGGSHLKREKNPPHAREEKTQKDAAAPRTSIHGEALAGLAQLTTSDSRPLALWPLHRTPATTISRRAAAAEVRHRAPALGCLSVRDVAAVLRPFFVAGWSASDVLHALDWRPDGTHWPHDGAPTWTDTCRVRGWLRYRLAAWTRDGEPVRSREQRKQAFRTEQAAERRRILEKQAERAARAAVDGAPVPWRVRLAQHGYTPEPAKSPMVQA